MSGREKEEPRDFEKPSCEDPLIPGPCHTALQIYSCQENLSREKFEVEEKVESFLEAFLDEEAACASVFYVELELACGAVVVARLQVHDFFWGVMAGIAALPGEMLVDPCRGIFGDAGVVSAIGTE